MSAKEGGAATTVRVFDLLSGENPMKRYGGTTLGCAPFRSLL
jgi:hypothetical protein